MHLKLKTWNPGIGNWNPHPLMHLLLINVIIWNPLHHLDITIWCYDDVMICFGRNVWTCTWSTEWEYLLWVEMPKWMLWPPLLQRVKWQPQVHTMTLFPRHLNMPPHWVSQGTFLLKCVENIICTGMYKVSKTWVCTKLKHLLVSI